MAASYQQFASEHQALPSPAEQYFEDEIDEDKIDECAIDEDAIDNVERLMKRRKRLTQRPRMKNPGKSRGDK